MNKTSSNSSSSLKVKFSNPFKKGTNVPNKLGASQEEEDDTTSTTLQGELEDLGERLGEQLKGELNKATRGDSQSKTKRKKEKKATSTQESQIDNAQVPYAEMKALMMADINKTVVDAFNALLPRLVQAVAETVEKTLASRLDRLDRDVERIHQTQDRDRAITLKNLDKQEQNNRRENIRISGVLEKEGETERDLIEAIVEIAGETGVAIDAKRDISEVYRVGRPGSDTSRPRTVLVRLMSRTQKIQIMKGKKQLKNNTKINNSQRYKKVFINEDLTAPRVKLLKAATDATDVEYAFTRHGAVHCKLRNGKFQVIENPDDLFKIGLDNVVYSDFY